MHCNMIIKAIHDSSVQGFCSGPKVLTSKLMPKLLQPFKKIHSRAAQYLWLKTPGEALHSSVVHGLDGHGGAADPEGKHLLSAVLVWLSPLRICLSKC